MFKNYRKSKLLFLILLNLIFVATGSTQTDAVEPQRITLTWEGDPATTQSVVWRTDAMVENPCAEIALLAPHLNIAGKNANTVPASTETITIEAGPTVYYHTARFQNLSPAQYYLYRVGDGKIWSEWNTFRTADKENLPFQFLYLGDVQNDILSKWSVLIRQAFSRAPMARFYLYAGDLVNRGQDDDNWREFFAALGFIPRMIPTVPVPGNHDTSRKLLGIRGSRLVDPLYRAHFALPKNGPDDKEEQESAFFMDYQGMRLIAVNTNSNDNPAQLQWLEKVLKESRANWNIVCHHHPLFSVGNDRNDSELRKNLMPIYQQYQVDIVLQGHDHRYGRTNKIVNEQTVSDSARAPIYIVSVSGPKAYRHNPHFAHLLHVEAGETQCYQIINVTPEELRYEAWSLDNQLIDAFALRKTVNGTVLVNLK